MRDWEGTSVLVTGASGFVGSHLVDALMDTGARIVGLVRDYSDDHMPRGAITVRGDLSSAALIERTISDYSCEIVYHLAAQAIVGVSKRNPVETFESNIRGTWNLLEACRRQSKHIRRVVVASSDKAYGDARPPYREDMAMMGKGPYDVSKSCCDLLAQSYLESYSLPVTVVRCGNIYGPGDPNFNRIIPGTIKAVKNGERPVIRTDGKLMRDYIYISDVVEAYLRCSEADVDGAFNFGTGKRRKVSEVVSTILEVMGSELKPVVLGEKTGEIQDQWLSSSKARKVLNWRPNVDFRKGIELTCGSA